MLLLTCLRYPMINEVLSVNSLRSEVALYRTKISVQASQSEAYPLLCEQPARNGRL
jgi:hypothetical protein